MSIFTQFGLAIRKGPQKFNKPGVYFSNFKIRPSTSLCLILSKEGKVVSSSSVLG